MVSEKVAGALSEFGIDVDASELQHYGVKGMKWGKTTKKDDAPLFDKTTTTSGITGYGEKHPDGFYKNYKMYSVSKTRQGTINKFIEGLFDKKKTTNVKDINGNYRKLTTTKQGKVNKFIENAFNKIAYKPGKTTTSNTSKVTSITGRDGTKYDPKTKKPIK